MKKTLFYLLAVISVAVSCQLEDATSIKTSKNDYPTFTASIASGTKVALDGTALTWEAGDQISITKDGKTAIYQATEAGESVKFEYVSGEFGEGTGEYIAYYPASLSAKTFPASFTCDPEEVKSLPMHAVAATAEDALSFQTYGGLLKIKVSKDAGEAETITINQIQVSFNEVVAGVFRDSVVAGEYQVLMPATGQKTLKVNPTTPVELTSEPSVFYVATPANTYTTGMSVMICTNKGTKEVTTTKDFTLERAHIKPMTVSAISSSDFATPVARTTNDGGTTWTPYASLQDAISGIMPNGDKSQCIVELLDDYTMTEPVFVEESKTFTFDGAKKTIYASGLDISDMQAYGITQYAAFYINTISDIEFKDVTIDGGSTVDSLEYRAIAIAKYDKNSKLLLTGETTIQNFYTKVSGSAVRVNASLYMKDNSKIKNCESSTKAGAISLTFGNVYCHLYMEDNSSITNCHSLASGGAIANISGYSGTSATLVTMKGNSSISECTAANYGGAIVDSNLDMNDNASISNCTATSYYGGAFYGYAFKMTGDTYIDGCSSTTGGGVYCMRNSSMSDNACIKNCTSSGNSGGVLASGKYTFTMSGNSSIINCTSGGYGGAIRLLNSMTFNVGPNEGDNPVISGNTAKTSGLAISNSAGTCTISRGTISGSGTVPLIHVASTTSINGGFYLQESTGGIHSNSSKITVTNSASDCYLSHSTDKVGTDYQCIEITDADANYAAGYRYKVTAK